MFWYRLITIEFLSELRYLVDQRQQASLLNTQQNQQQTNIHLPVRQNYQTTKIKLKINNVIHTITQPIADVILPRTTTKLLLLINKSQKLTIHIPKHATNTSNKHKLSNTTTPIHFYSNETFSPKSSLNRPCYHPNINTLT